MSVNDAFSRGEIITMAVPAAASVASGDVLIFGRNQSPTYNIAGIAMESDPPVSARTATHEVAVKFTGVFLLSVVAKSSINGSNLAIAPGDPVFADGGTYDATTGVTYGCTLNVNNSHGYLVGNSLDTLATGTTGKIRVRLQGGA